MDKGHTHEGHQLLKSRASSKHRAPAYAAQACERAKAAACVDAKADAPAAASVTPPRGISCARAEHQVSIEHKHTPPKHASERVQRRVSMQKLTLPQPRASHPHEGDQLSLQKLRSCKACTVLYSRPVLYRYRTVPELDISTFFP